MPQAQLTLDIRERSPGTDDRVGTRTTAHSVRASDAAVPAVLLSVMEVAHLLGCGRTLVYELIGTGQLGTVKLGRLRRIPADELDRLVERLRVAAG